MEEQVKLRCGATVTPVEADTVRGILLTLSAHGVPYRRCGDLLKLVRVEIEECSIDQRSIEKIPKEVKEQ